MRILDPEVSLIQVARTVVPAPLRDRFDLEQHIPELAGTSLALSTVAERLPAHLDRIVRALDHPSLARGTRILARPDDRRWVRAQITDVLTAGFGVIACILAVVLVLHTGVLC